MNKKAAWVGFGDERGKIECLVAGLVWWKVKVDTRKKVKE